MIRIVDHYPDAQTDTVAKLFWQAFGGKLGRVLGPEQKATAFLARALNPNFAISAIRDDMVVGIAGFKTTEGGLVGGNLADLQAIYGRFGGLWRGVILEMLERDIAADELLMDGIFVADAARGQGVGSLLLDSVAHKAGDLGLSRIRLDVIDTNPRARALYARRGFVAGQTKSIGWLRYLLGFRLVTTMTRLVT